MDRVAAAQLPTIAPTVRRCVAYHHTGLTPGIHLGLPSPTLTVVLSIGSPTVLAAVPGPTRPPAPFWALVSGLWMGPATIAYDREMCGIQLDITPQGARSLFGVPASQLAHGVVEMEDVLGPAAAELLDRLHEAEAWDDRIAAVDEILGRGAPGGAPAQAQVDRAWRLIESTAGTMRITDVADAVGWSRRHLDREFEGEFGLTPKDVARLARFSRSRQLVTERPGTPLAAVAAECGYCDQPHLAREWKRFVGTPASAWWRSDGVQFFQDDATAAVAS